MKLPRCHYWTSRALFAATVLLTATPAYATGPYCGFVSLQPVAAIAVLRNLTSGHRTLVTRTDTALRQNPEFSKKAALAVEEPARLPALQPAEDPLKPVGLSPRLVRP